MKKHLFLRGLALFLCLSLIVGFVPGGIFANLLKVNAASDTDTPREVLINGNFEEVDEETQAPVGWFWKNPALQLSADEGVDGSKAAKVDATNGKAIYFKQTLNVAGGEELTFSLLAKRLSGTTNAYAGFWFYDANGNLVPENTAYFISDVASTEEWAQYTLTQAIPEGAVTVDFELGNFSKRDSVYLIDNVSVTMVGGEEPEPAVTYPLNGDFEADLENWTGNLDFCAISTDDVYAGEKSMLFTDNTDAKGPYIHQNVPVEKDKTYVLSAMVKRVAGTGKGYIGVFGISNAVLQGVATVDNEWTKYSVEVTIVDDVTEASIEIGASKSPIVTYLIDNVVFTEKGKEPVEPEPTEPKPTEPKPTEPEIIAPDDYWIPDDFERPVIENFASEHPYLYFDAAGLEELRQFKNDTTKNIYDFTWAGQVDTLIAIAESFLVETEVVQSFNFGTTVTFQVSPHLRDVNDLEYYRPLYEASSKDENGNLVENPYLGFGSVFVGSVQDRLEILSLAYAITGDTRYSDLAIRYATEFCQWKWWGDKNWLDTYGNGSYKADAGNAWGAQGVAAVYDMCYDLLTEEEKNIMETAIIEHGLKPLSQEVDPYATDNVNMMMIAGLLTGSAAIINEDNYEEIKPYVDLALYCVFVAFDNYAYSGNTEGHYYTSYGLEYFLPGVSHMYQATGLESLFDHPLLSEMLPYWTVQFASPASMTHPTYSDVSSAAAYLKLPMAIISKNVENGLAGYFVTKTGGLGSPWANLVYLDPTPVVEEPTDLVSVVDSIGYGALRTGFANDDMLLTLLANNSQLSHNHLDQNSIQLSVAGNWLITDPGVGSYYYNDRSFWTQSGHTTILVDNKAQTVRGTGTMEKIFGSNLYGYIIGSAPKAYGGNLDKFDRHAIQLNHEEKAYYIIIDDLASSQERTYTWQMYNGDRLGFSIDGMDNPADDTLGNEALVSLSSGDVRLSFVDGDKLTMGIKTYIAGGENVGSTFVASSAATKAHQFMTVISTETAGGRDFINFPNLLKAASRDVEHMADDEVSWKTSATGNRDMIKHNVIGTTNCLFFRGGAPGDFIRVPVTVKEDGTYDISISLGVSTGCCQVKVYFDDAVSEVVDCSGWPEYFKDFDFNDMELKAGQHYVKVEIIDAGLDEAYAGAGWYLVNMNGMYMTKQGENEAAEEIQSVVVKETYDDENALGALINYAGDLCDLVMFNRTDALVAAGKLSSDGQQASVLGLDNGKITEGFAATKATKLIYDGKTLFEAEKALNIVADAEGWHVDTAEAQTIKLNAGLGDVIVTVNGEAVEATVEDGMIVVALEAGASDIALVEAEVEDPTDPSEPADPTDPSEPADPTDPSEPADPTDPSEPADPTDPSEPDDGGNSGTGDTAPIAAMVALTVLVMTGIALIVNKRKLF